MLAGLSASAQFRKPLTSPRDKVQSSEAKFNIGLFGGGNFTTWFHIHKPEASDWYLANYAPQLKFGYFGGVAVEYMFTPNQSVGLNVLYAQHNMHINHTNNDFPIGLNQHVQRVHDLEAYYSAVEAYVPLTFYFPADSKRNIMPYVYVAPRVSYNLGGTMKHSWTDFDLNTRDTIASSFSELMISDTTYRMLNVGATVGAGSLFKINTNNYYFIVKFDVSANVNGISTFTGADLQNEFNHLRYNADAQATLTFMLPIKKRLKGACMKWGEYD